MAEYVDPWTKATAGKPGPCHYGCGWPASMTEPGTAWKAHKACAMGWRDDPVPTITWDGEDHKITPDGPLGCGGDQDPIVSSRRCGSNGGALTCQLCPNSPTYWNREGRYH